MSYITRTNPNTMGMGCAHCGGECDDFDSPAYGYAAAQSGRDQPGIDYSAMGMPSQTQLLAMSSGGAIQPLTQPSTANYPYAVDGGYPASVNGPSGIGALGATTSNVLAQTSPDYPTPTALTVSQAFQSAVNGGGAQPGTVSLPMLNWAANNLSFVKPAAAPDCPVTNWVNTTNPLFLIGGVFAIVYLANMTAAKRRRARGAVA